MLRSDVMRHIWTVHGNQRFTCEQCNHSFTRRENYNTHSCQPTRVKIIKKVYRCQRDSQTTMLTSREHRWLLPGKAFCEKCSHKGRECKLRHRHMPERIYSQRVDHPRVTMYATVVFGDGSATKRGQEIRSAVDEWRLSRGRLHNNSVFTYLHKWNAKINL